MSVVGLGGTPRRNRIHRARRVRRSVVALALMAGLAGLTPLATAGKTSAAPTARYVISGIAPAGVTVLGDYGGAALVELTAAQVNTLRAAGVSVDALADTNLLKLNRLVVDTAQALPDLPAALRAPAAPTSWVIQLVGPAAPGWLETVAAAGLRPVAHGYVPENGWLVRGRADAAARVDRLPFVQAVIPYAPAYRLSPRLDNLLGAVEVRLLVFDDADLSATAAKIAALGATELGRIDAADMKLLHVRLDAGALTALARLDTVQWIEPALPLELHNDHAADTMGVRPVWDGITEAPATPFRGAGEIAAVADTGIDTGEAGTIHPDFADHIVDLQAWGRPGDGDDPIHNGDPSDTHGHGTHTAGSVVGDGTAWGTLNLAGCTMTCDAAKSPAGMAPDAGLVFQSIADAEGSLAGVPEDPGELYQAAYDQGARVHSNSYGSDAAGAYDAQAMLLDRFMATHPDMLITFSAGNSGTDADTNGIIDPGSMGSPATAKNTLSVGASEDNRGAAFTSGDAGDALLGVPSGQPLYSTYAVFYVPPAGPPIETDFMSNSAEGMVAFSSRGPTQDGRLKPDVVGIGTHVLSARTTIIDAGDIEAHYWSRASHGSSIANPAVGDYPVSADDYYGFMGGTSMSNPLVAGTAVDVRQYLRVVRGFQSPSAALLKAALTAGAHELQGQYDPLHPDVTARPDINEGWGLVDVANTIDPAGPTKVAYFDDPMGLRTGASARYTFDVTNSSVPLRVQLAWTDVPGNLVAQKTLVNDLDLVVTAPNGTVYRGNMFNARAGGVTLSTANPPSGNRVDNVEGVMVNAPATGTWTVRVAGFAVPAAPQKYGLVVRGGFSSVPTGSVHLDAAAYKSNGRPVTIVVSDPTVTKTSVKATVKSTSAQGGVIVTLPKVAGQQGVYLGTINVGAPGSPASSASIPGANGDSITVTYKDAGGTTRTVTAGVDNRAPVVSGVTQGAATPFSSAASFHTDEPAAGTIQIGGAPGIGNLSASATEPALVLDRTVTVPSLVGGKRYYYRALGTDDPGNVGLDANGGKFYTVRTPASTVEYTYDAETETGWTHQANPDAAAPAADAWHLTTRADAVHGGTKAWLYGPEDPEANYEASSDAFLESPVITRVAQAWASVDAWANYDSEKGFDGLNFYGSDDNGSTYELLPIVSIGAPSGPELAAAQIDGNSGGYRKLTFDLSGFTGPTLKLRIQFYSDTGVELGGAAVDDITVYGSKTDPVKVTNAPVAVATSAKRGIVVTIGKLLPRPKRDWVRLDKLTVTRTGTATDADVPQAILVVSGGGPSYGVPFVNGVAVFNNIAADFPQGTTQEVHLAIGVAANANTSRTVSLQVKSTNIKYAAPDVVAESSSTTTKWQPVKIT